MPKFKKHDVIEAIERGRGLERAKVLEVYKTKEMYLLKIMNGTALIPFSAEVNYRICKEK